MRKFFWWRSSHDKEKVFISYLYDFFPLDLSGIYLRQLNDSASTNDINKYGLNWRGSGGGGVDDIVLIVLTLILILIT
jgi:hypothetical protein